MFTRSIARLILALVIFVAALLFITSITTTIAIAHPQADLIVNPGESIQAAIDAANDGDTIIVNAGDYTESLTLSKPVSLTGVNSDTTIIHAVAGQRVLTVTGATISNSVVISGLTFTGGDVSGGFTCPDYCGGGILITDTAYPLIQHVTVIDNIADRGGGLYSSDAVALEAAEFISNTAREGGGIYAVNSVTLTGASFVQNRTTQDFGNGGGLYVFRGTLDLSNTQFLSNTASIQGGGGYVWGTAILDHARFLGNTALDGGGLYVMGATTVSNSRFEYNQVPGSGGGIYTAQTLTLSDTDFVDNSGGGVYAAGSATVSGGRFENNISEGGYGGLATAGSLALSGTQFISNTGTAVGAGSVTAINTRFIRNFSRSLGIGAGGLFAGSATLTDTDFISNTAWGNGGGLDTAYATLINVRFINNQSVYGYGGGLHAYQLIMTNSQFTNNVAFDSGGGASADRADLTGGRFEGNVSKNRGGGGISAEYVSMTDTIFISNTAFYGGGLSAAGSGADIVGGRFENNRTTGMQYAHGGGLSVFAFTAQGTAIHITGTQFINNSSTSGGGVSIESNINNSGLIVNALFASNHAADNGAAIVVQPNTRLDVINTSIADKVANSTTAIVTLNASAVHLTNTIIANHAIGISNTGGTVTEDYNLFYGNVTNTVGVSNGTHNLVGDPRFVDPAHDDYHLAFGSAAIDRGVEAGVYTDLDGNIRPHGAGFDIGAYEYQSVIYRAFLPLIQK